MAREDDGDDVHPEGERVAPAYRAPALEKGLDVLELLAVSSEPLGQTQIAQHLGRSVQEVYRVVLSLERRGYVVRVPPSEGFQLSTRLYDLAVHHPPIRRVTEVAQPILHRLALEVDQALTLAVLDGAFIRIVAQVDNPAPIGFRVRLGALSSVATTASGRTLLAFQTPAMQAWVLARVRSETGEGIDAGRLLRRVHEIRRQGYEMVSGETLKGITDVSFPILRGQGDAVSALTMPFLDWVANKTGCDEASRKLFRAAAEISAAVGGVLRAPSFPLVQRRWRTAS
jgi:DNA-binding IclR family transcriptional regulator